MELYTLEHLLILYTIFIHNTYTKPVSVPCNKLPTVNTFWTLDPFENFPKPSGTKIPLMCANGHQDPLNRDTIEAICENGQWTLPSVPCIKRHCVDLPDIENGKIFKPPGYNELGGRAFVLCNNGFEIEGSAVSTNGVLQCMMWLNNQTLWQPQLPRCVESRLIHFRRPKRCRTLCDF